MVERKQAIIIDPKDNVATAIVDLQSGDKVYTDSGPITLVSNIAFGHKFALITISAGEYVVKYGAHIGRATAAISPGEHVHVQNVEDIVDEVRKAGHENPV